MRKLFSSPLGRFVRFGAIGLLCLLAFHQPLLWLLAQLGMHPLVANVVGFVFSGVANFGLQNRYTFDKAASRRVTGSLKFLATSLVSLGINSAGFYLFHFVWGWGMNTSSVIPAVGGSLVSFTLSHLWGTFRSTSQEGTKSEMTEAPQEYEQTLGLGMTRLAVGDVTLCHFLPAYNEGQNLAATVADLHAYFSGISLLEFRIVIVNDGSKDNTAQVADELAAKYPEVEVIHHQVNRGYGGALITGFHAAADSGMGLWSFCDSDRQFAPESWGTLLGGYLDSDRKADMVVGYRIGRKDADSKFRYLLGRAWHVVSKFVMGRNSDGTPLLSVRDVDCGFKLGKVKALSSIVDLLQGRAAAISPELIARSNLAGHSIVECGVTHLPRVAGESTGSKPSVMIKSALNILWLGLRLRMESAFSWVGTSATTESSVKGR